ncbi:DUF1189 domain-containing protein [Anaerobacillus alkaliphilus]|uniref:DUF1189 domain-containing protein n=1 Tax=Anaerobacillus alkaliphilus TaxID=1548597 RepID=A0A4V1LG79_9BACI|nr:DUF1189 domain-containing protein [Anaerobacillus alkaliphilus]RXI99438.1 DUF1189 domain-containing protein [Anaerobacillus alkaliphilus]
MNIFQQFIKSIYSPPTVAKFRFQGIGKTILYVFVLMLITTSITAYQLATTISTTVQQFQADLRDELPDFELRNSILISDIEEPIYLTQNGDMVIFDTTGTLTKAEIENRYNNVLALLETEAVLVSEGVAESFRYRDLGNINMSKQQVEELTETVVDLLPLIISMIVLILYLVLTALKFIGIFVLTLFGLIMKKTSEATLSYKQIWILSAYAVTLPTVFFAVTDALRIQIPISFTLYWVVAVIMLYLIFKEIPKPKQEELEKQDSLDKY